ncbi:hypothetical protein [Alicyclobacillus fodiniaquatilis]|uniref:Uncharacterized protein n=1 Tax=Alicyclobacillus fodiniaquatilis TaxID=1661150 RepID=A0ABW4JMA6_9BACL
MTDASQRPRSTDPALRRPPYEVVRGTTGNSSFDGTGRRSPLDWVFPARHL